MPRQRILVVEDHPDMNRFYDNLLRQLGRKTPLEYFLAKSVPEARRLMEKQAVDLIILDWMLPGTSGLDLLKEVRGRHEHKDILVIVVTAKGMAKDCAEALDAGADDFLSKPFNVDVLLARLRSLARRQERPWQAATPIECCGIRLDPSRGEVTAAGKPVHLHPKEMLLLEVFLRRPGVLHTAAALWERGWGFDSDNWEHILVSTISSLKKSLGPKKGELLECRRSLGYIFNP
ncbi:MAG: response regulator transcription factor [Elusimicrobia bacterium]|nr:response regulator transcription factor [Elusimicrobiota bacterium]